MISISTNEASALRRLLDESERIVITCHVGPDGDAIGSSLAMHHVLARMGKEARVVCPDMLPANLYYLPGARDITVFTRSENLAEQLIADADLIICLDYNDIKRIDRVAPSVLAASAPKLLIDHHLDPSVEAALVISRPEASSTCELLYTALCAAGMEEYIDRPAASCIYAGMMTDTGNFSYNSNSPQVYRIVADLLERGVNKDEIYRHLMGMSSENRLRLTAYAILEKMQVFHDMGAALIVLTRDELKRFDYHKGDTESLVNMPLAIPGIAYSVFLRDDERYVKVSMRSVGDFPVNVLCERYFGGGGHLNAAGGEFNGSMEECIAIVMEAMKDNQQKYIESKRH